MIQYTEPDEYGDLFVKILSKETAIKRGKLDISNRMMSYNVAPSDAEALEDFKTTHAAYEVPDIYNHYNNIDKFLERIYNKIQIRTRKDFETTEYQARLEFGVSYMVSDFEYSESELEDADKFFRELVKKNLATYIYHDVNSS